MKQWIINWEPPFLGARTVGSVAESGACVGWSPDIRT